MKKNIKKVLVVGAIVLTLALGLFGNIGGGITPKIDPPFGLINLK